MSAISASTFPSSPLSEKEVIEMEEIKPQGMLVSIEIKGNTDISYMPKLFALAQEAGLEIKFQGSNADKKSNLN